MQLKKHARKVRDLRHVATTKEFCIPMKLSFDIAKSYALRPNGHGPVALRLSNRECGTQDFIPHD
ncbi:hypothetical protein [Lysobacter fragariae]